MSRLAANTERDPAARQDPTAAHRAGLPPKEGSQHQKIGLPVVHADEGRA